MAPRDLLITGAFGVIGQGTYQLLWAGSLGTINAGTSALLISVTPFLTAIFAALFRIDPLRPATIAGGLIAFAGVTAVALGEGGVRLEGQPLASLQRCSPPPVGLRIFSPAHG